MPLERKIAGHGLVDHDAQRPEIARRSDRLAERLLGGHVGSRAHARVDLGELGRSRHLGQAEIHQGD